MKKIGILLGLLAMVSHGMALDYINGPKFLPGAIATSPNGKFTWQMESDGYFTVNEVIAGYGKLLLFQDMFTGKGVPGQPRYAHYRKIDGSLYFGYRQYADEASWYNYVHSLGYVDITRMTIDNVGNVRIYITEASSFVLVRTYDNTTPVTIARSNYHGNIRVKNNYYFLRPLNDEHKTTYFSTANIFMLDQANIIQKTNPIVFTAKASIQLLPGFVSSVSGTGSILMKPLPPTPPKAARAATEPPVVKAPPSQFKVFPNPSSDYFTIEVDAGDMIESVELYDAEGKLVLKEGQNKNYNISQLPVGPYLYKVQTKQQQYSGKIIKQ